MSHNNSFSALRDYLSVAPIARAIIRSREIELILSEKDFSGRIIDLGLGDGIFESILARHDLLIQFGIDHSFSVLKLAASAASSKLSAGDMEKLPIRNETCDGIISNCVLEHIDNLPSSISEMHRILKKNGKVLATVVTDRYPELLFWPRFFSKFGLKFFAKKYIAFIDEAFVHRRYPKTSEWKKFFEDSGFQVVKTVSYVGPRRQALMDIMLPFVGLGRVMRNFFGREIFLKRLWLAGFIERLLSSDEEKKSESDFANVFIMAVKK